jgi:anaerobic dimethyl sulfoxide reductase subunit B (iron-sulfur subunit)
MEHGFEPDHFGIKIFELGPWQIEGTKWQHANMPLFSEQCDLCVERTSQEKLPSCVHHCQAACLSYGELATLAIDLAKKPQQALFSLK